MSRLLRSALAVALVAGALTGCARRKDERKEELLEAISRTKGQPRTFAYEDQPLSGARIGVNGVVVDAFKAKARVTLNGAPVKDEVVVDDALATRFVDPSTLGVFVDQSKAALAVTAPPAAPGAAPSAPPLEVLQAGRWVLDPAGAPSLILEAGTKRMEGDDPVVDAFTVLDYVARIVTARGVALYNKDALEPVYKPDEDRFEKPEQGAPVKRYDVPLADFPKADEGGNANRVIVPGVDNFRKLAVFVRDGVVVEIREDIDVASRIPDLRRNFDIDQAIDVDQAVSAINAVRKGKGEDAFRPRQMRVSFSPVAPEDVVELPPANEALVAPLGFLKGRGATVVKGKGTSTSTTAPAAGA